MAVVDNTILRGKKVLVTGGTGFIGRHLVRELIARGAEVRVLIRTDSKVSRFQGRTEVFHGDLADPESLARSCNDTEIVFHAAGFAHAWQTHAPKIARLHWQINARGTKHLLEAAANTGVERFIFFSSVKAMGEGENRCVNESWPAPPLTPYGKAKRTAEDWVLETGRACGMHVVNLRLALVYGPGGHGNLERMVDAVRRGVFPPFPEVGNKRSMVHVEDVVRAALLAVTKPAANQKTYIVTDGHGYSTREIYDLICRALGKEPPRWSLPVAVLKTLAWLGSQFRQLTGKQMGFDQETLEKLLGWAWYSSEKIQHELGFNAHRTPAESFPDILRKNLSPGKVRSCRF